MRILQGTKVSEAPAGWREALLASQREVVLDIGAGDGRFVYESARADRTRFYLALDADASALAEYSFRASRKPARGGVENACFVVAVAQEPPPELVGLAHRLCVNFPWGSLLRGLLTPEPQTLAALSCLGRPGAAFDFVLCYDPGHDRGAFAGGALPELSLAYVDAALLPAYAEAGLDLTERRLLSREEALAIPSSWGRRLLHARPREVYLLQGAVSRRA